MHPCEWKQLIQIRAVEALLTYSCQASDIDASEVSGDSGSWLVDLAKPIESRIRNGYTGFLRVYRCVGKVGGLAQV